MHHPSLSSSFIMHHPSLFIIIHHARSIIIHPPPGGPLQEGAGGFSRSAEFYPSYVRPPPRQEHQENHRDWLARFVKEEWGSSTDRKETDRLKALCKRCRQIFLEEEKIVAELRVGPGRGRQGFRSSRTLLDQRKRKKGGGRKITCPELGYELFQWTVDTINNLKSRLFGWMLTEQARIIKQDIET